MESAVATELKRSPNGETSMPPDYVNQLQRRLDLIENATNQRFDEIMKRIEPIQRSQWEQTAVDRERREHEDRLKEERERQLQERDRKFKSVVMLLGLMATISGILGGWLFQLYFKGH